MKTDTDALLVAAMLMLERFETAGHLELGDLEGTLWNDLDGLMIALRRQLDAPINDRATARRGWPRRSRPRLRA